MPASGLSLDPRAVVLEVVKRAVGRLIDSDIFGAEVPEPLSADVAALLRAQAHAQLDVTNSVQRVIDARTADEREHALDDAAAQIFTMFVEVMLHGGRIPGDRSMPLTRESVGALVDEPLRCSLDAI